MGFRGAFVLPRVLSRGFRSRLCRQRLSLQPSIGIGKIQDAVNNNLCIPFDQMRCWVYIILIISLIYQPALHNAAVRIKNTAVNDAVVQHPAIFVEIVFYPFNGMPPGRDRFLISVVISLPIDIPPSIGRNQNIILLHLDILLIRWTLHSRLGRISFSGWFVTNHAAIRIQLMSIYDTIMQHSAIFVKVILFPFNIMPSCRDWFMVSVIIPLCANCHPAFQ